MKDPPLLVNHIHLGVMISLSSIENIKWFLITTPSYNLCHTYKYRLLPLTVGLHMYAIWLSYFCHLPVMYVYKDRVWRCGLSTVRDISHGFNQLCGRCHSDWHSRPRILCVEISMISTSKCQPNCFFFCRFRC